MDVYNKMFEELISSNTSSIPKSTGSELLDDHRIRLSFFEKNIVVDLNKKEIFYSEDNSFEPKKFLDPYSASIILHYLLNADGTPLEGRWASYRELPGGLFYWRTIPGVLEPLVKKYESNGSGFLEKALEIGGERYGKFKFSFIIRPFKMFPVLMIFDEKSTEFEANIRILFDGSAHHYLKTDVVKLIIIYIVKRLCDKV